MPDPCAAGFPRIFPKGKPMTNEEREQLMTEDAALREAWATEVDARTVQADALEREAVRLIGAATQARKDKDAILYQRGVEADRIGSRRDEIRRELEVA